MAEESELPRRRSPPPPMFFDNPDSSTSSSPSKSQCPSPRSSGLMRPQGTSGEESPRMSGATNPLARGVNEWGRMPGPSVAYQDGGRGECRSPRMSTERNLQGARVVKDVPILSGASGGGAGGGGSVGGGSVAGGSVAGGGGDHRPPSQVLIFRYHSAQSPPYIGCAAPGVEGTPASHVIRHPCRGELSRVPLPQNFFCPCCADVLQNPVTLSCLHNICQNCFDQGLRRTPPGSQVVCPIVGCYAPIKGTPVPNIQLRKSIGKVEIRCVNGISFDVVKMRFKMLKIDAYPPPPDFCKEILSYETLEAHIRVCPHKLVFCRYRAEGCPEICLIRDVANHESFCAWKKVPCPKCQGEVAEVKLGDHLAETCPMAMVHCAYANIFCPYVSPRKEIQAHVSSCPFGNENVEAAFKRLLGELATVKKLLSEEHTRASHFQRELEYYKQQRGVR